MDIFEQMEARFSSTSFPTGYNLENITKKNENLTQWLLEASFFRDFIYRNPMKKPGKEFSDSLVIIGDTLISVHNKTKVTKKTNNEWIPKNLNNALKQLIGGYRNITQGLISKFYNELLEEEIIIDQKKYKYIYGLIILALNSDPFDPTEYIDKSNTPNFPYAICSLEDLLIITDRMDTAADFITYFESRYNSKQFGVKLLFNDELNNMIKISEVLPNILEKKFGEITDENKEKSIKLSKEMYIKSFKDRDDYRFSILIDDVISHIHDADPRYTMNSATDRLSIATKYGFIDRKRRIALGKILYQAALESSKNSDKIITHIQKPIKQVYIYIFTKLDREKRRELLISVSAAAQKKYSYTKIISLATEPYGYGGRSYDIFDTEELLFDNYEDVTDELLSLLPEDLDKQLV